MNEIGRCPGSKRRGSPSSDPDAYQATTVGAPSFSIFRGKSKSGGFLFGGGPLAKVGESMGACIDRPAYTAGCLRGYIFKFSNKSHAAPVPASTLHAPP